MRKIRVFFDKIGCWFFDYIEAIIIIAIIGLLFLGMYALSRSSSKKFDDRYSSNTSTIPGFVVVCKNEPTGMYFFRETLTNYMYIGNKYSTYPSAYVFDTSPMYDPETGLPLTYERFKELLHKRGLIYNEAKKILETQPTTPAGP